MSDSMLEGPVSYRDPESLEEARLIRDDLGIRITMIFEQLADESRKEKLGPDYASWRQRAQSARHHLQRVREQYAAWIRVRLERKVEADKQRREEIQREAVERSESAAKRREADARRWREESHGTEAELIEQLWRSLSAYSHAYGKDALTEALLGRAFHYLRGKGMPKKTPVPEGFFGRPLKEEHEA